MLTNKRVILFESVVLQGQSGAIVFGINLVSSIVLMQVFVRLSSYITFIDFRCFDTLRFCTLYCSKKLFSNKCHYD